MSSLPLGRFPSKAWASHAYPAFAYDAYWWSVVTVSTFLNICRTTIQTTDRRITTLVSLFLGPFHQRASSPLPLLAPEPLPSVSPTSKTRCHAWWSACCTSRRERRLWHTWFLSSLNAFADCSSADNGLRGWTGLRVMSLNMSNAALVLGARISFFSSLSCRRQLLAWDRHLRSKCSSLHISRSSAEPSAHHLSSSSLSPIRAPSHFLWWQTAPRATSPVSFPGYNSLWHAWHQARFLRMSCEIFITVSASFAFGPVHFISLFESQSMTTCSGRPTHTFDAIEEGRELHLLDGMLHIILELHRTIDPKQWP